MLLILCIQQNMQINWRTRSMRYVTYVTMYVCMWHVRVIKRLIYMCMANNKSNNMPINSIIGTTTLLQKIEAKKRSKKAISYWKRPNENVSLYICFRFCVGKQTCAISWCNIHRTHAYICIYMYMFSSVVAGWEHA